MLHRRHAGTQGGVRLLIDEHEWRSVLQVAEDGTFSAAAKHLYVSQPSLSQCIKKIEGELGEALFDRSPTPLQLTSAGEIYVEKARQIQRLKQELVKGTADLSELRTGNLCIGSSRTRSSCYLTQPLIDFHRNYPGNHSGVPAYLHSRDECSYQTGYSRRAYRDRYSSRSLRSAHPYGHLYYHKR